MILYGRQDITQADIDARVGGRHAMAVNSAAPTPPGVSQK